jgi:hypothetical protein
LNTKVETAQRIESTELKPGICDSEKAFLRAFRDPRNWQLKHVAVVRLSLSLNETHVGCYHESMQSIYLPVLAGLFDTKHNEDLCNYALQTASEEG